MAYATMADVQSRMDRVMSDSEVNICDRLLDDAAVIIDAYNKDADLTVKSIVSSRMVQRALGDGETDYPMGATQGSMSGLGYSQSWTVSSGGAVGELYLNKLEKKLLGIGDKIGSHSPLEDMVVKSCEE